MKTIWKYELAILDEQDISAPADWEPLSVQLQRGVPCLWAAVDSDKPVIQHRLWIHGTGHKMSEMDRLFVGTFQMPDLGLVFHVFVFRGL
jgi:hypothetical protein